MEKLRTELQKAYINLKTFLKWVGISCLIGCIVGAAGILFHLGLTLATNLRTEHPFLLFALPFGGLLIVLLYKLCGMEKDRGTNFVLVAVRSNEKLSFKTAPLIFISTIITHLLGGSAGREGAALQLGGSIAAKIGDIFKPDDKDKRIITMCGMSAAFSAVFGTPVTAAIFSLEVVSVGVMYYAALVPCILSSVIGYSLARLVNIQPTKFTIPFVPDLSFSVTLKVIITAGLCAVLSILFCLILKKTAVLYEKLTGNAYIRVFAGGCVIIALSLIFGTGKYNGAGMPAIEQAINGSASPEAFALKIIFTALTLGAGYKGGEIVPTFFIGATFGAAIGPLLGIPSGFCAALGLISLFCGVTNCTITSFILSIELFSSQGMIYFAIACAVSYMLSGYYGLYKEQKIVYSKTSPVFIDKKIH